MRINYIQISNVLSFNYYEEISQSPKIDFHKDLNILIGQNGSGKSTCLEVLNLIFQRILFPRYDTRMDFYTKRDSITGDMKRQILTKDNNTSFKDFRLDPHWDHETKAQKIRIAIQLDEIDQNNVNLINSRKSDLDLLAQIYSGIKPPQNLSMINDEFIIDIELNFANNQFTFKLFPEESNSGFTYLSNYNYYKELIILYNNDNLSKQIPSLQESFVLIGSFRNYNKFNQTVSLSSAPLQDQLKQLGTKEKLKSVNDNETSEPTIFSLVRLIAAKTHFDLSDTKLDKMECEDKANNSSILKQINQKLETVNLKCKLKLIELRTWEFSFEFIDTKRNRTLTSINSLSAGQKSIVHLIFEAYGRGNIKGGLIIIDEPEIHLHYQFQNEYLRIIYEINKEQKCQYILVTHSESLINSGTIKRVKRFYLDEQGNSKIKSPKLDSI